MSARTPARTYLIGPLERRGVLLGLRAGHLVLGVVCALAVVTVVNLLPDAVGLLFALALVMGAVAAALLPVGGRALDEWALVAARHLVARAAGITSWVSDAALHGQRLTAAPAWTGADDQHSRDARGESGDRHVRRVVRVDGRHSVPPSLRGVELWAATWAGDEIGIVRDRAWDRWSAVLAVRGQSFALLDRSEKEARLDDWGRVLASLARENSPLVRLQWIERTVPDDSRDVVRDLERLCVREVEDVAVRNVLTLVRGAAATTQQHELYLVVTVGAREARRAAKHLERGREEEICDVLTRELHAMTTTLEACGLTVVGVVGLRPLARMLQVAFDPGAERGLAQRAAVDAAWTGPAPFDALLQASDESWGELHVDGSYHRTYWVSEWPRCEVGPDLMVPLLLRTRWTRTVSVVLAVDSPSRALRRTEAQRRGDETTERTRERLGFSSGARRLREQEGAVRREQELASGHAHVRFSAHITVSGPTRERLDDACMDVERQARAAGLEVRPEYGMQADAFTFTLPLGRGLQ